MNADHRDVENEGDGLNNVELSRCSPVITNECLDWRRIEYLDVRRLDQRSQEILVAL